MRDLQEDEIERFREDGFVVLPDVLSPERLALLREIAEWAVEERERYRREHPDLVDRMHEAEARGEVIHATEWTHVVMQMYQLWERHPRAAEHSLDPELAGVARRLLGVAGLRLWFDQLMIKEPGGGPTPFHQDNAYMPVDAGPGVVTVWAPLVAAGDDMGCLRYVPGSHALDRLPPVPLTSLDDLSSVMPESWSLEDAVPGEVPEGGVVIHHGNVVHGAGPNVSDRRRPVVLTCYVPDGARRAGPIAQYVIDRDGVPDGGLLEGPGLPLVAAE